MSPADGLTIVAFLGHQTLGNFIEYGLTAASLARAVPGSRLAVVFRDDRPYKEFLVRCNPWVERYAMVPEDAGRVIPADWFDGRRDPDGKPFDAAWYERGFHAPDLLLVPHMMPISACLPPVPRLRIPDSLAGPLGVALARRGLDPERWFVGLHIREAGYEHRRGSDRSRCVDPQTYLPLVRHIIEERGGQVVRIGDPGATPFPAMAGLVDLSREADGFSLQAFAFSRARCVVATDSGPTQLADAFGTPTATTNAVGVAVWNAEDVALTKHFRWPGGRRLSWAELREAGILNAHRLRPKGVVLEDNRPEELIAVADHLLETAADCPGWRRAPPPQPPPESLEGLAFPRPWTDLVATAGVTFWETGDG